MYSSLHTIPMYITIPCCISLHPKVPTPHPQLRIPILNMSCYVVVCYVVLCSSIVLQCCAMLFGHVVLSCVILLLPGAAGGGQGDA